MVVAVEENDGLTVEAREFCYFYVRNNNALQSFMKAFGGTRAVAGTACTGLLMNSKIKAEIKRLRKIKNSALGGLAGGDIVELHMRIAFADMTDFVEFENNELRLRSSGVIDGNIVTEVSEGREGVKIKLADKARSLAFLENYFELNPLDKHKIEYENRRVALEEKKREEPAAVPEPVNERKYIAASLDFWEFCKLKAPDFYCENEGYLWEICQALQAFEKDENELLVLNIPPRHGKTRTVGLAASWYLGRNPSLKIIVASYNDRLSRQISRAVRDNISEVKADRDRAVFSDVFPGTGIQAGASSVDMWRLSNSPVNNYLAASPRSTATGFGADMLIFDDTVKNAYEANHKGVLDELFNWFTDTMYSRLEGKRKIIIVATRWATKDLAGRVLAMYEEQNRKRRVITKRAFDGHKMLSERILSKRDYEKLLLTVGEDIVRANYDQEPIDLKGRLYGEFLTYTESPDFAAVKAVCDTADEGADFLCLIIYGEVKGVAYVLDVYYTQAGMDETEQGIVQRLIEFSVAEITLESNFGGKGWAKHLQSLYEKNGGETCKFRVFHQKHNKEARILSCATRVQRQIIMPENWNKLFPLFYEHVTEFQRTGGKQPVDGPDTLTMIVEKFGKKRGFFGVE